MKRMMASTAFGYLVGGGNGGSRFVHGNMTSKEVTVPADAVASTRTGRSACCGNEPVHAIRVSASVEPPGWGAVVLKCSRFSPAAEKSPDQSGTAAGVVAR